MDAHALYWGASLPHCCRHLACASTWRCSEDMSWPSTSPVHTCFKVCNVTAKSALKSHLSWRLRFNPSVKWSMFGACSQLIQKRIKKWIQKRIKKNKSKTPSAAFDTCASTEQLHTSISRFHNYNTSGSCIKSSPCWWHGLNTRCLHILSTSLKLCLKTRLWKLKFPFKFFACRKLLLRQSLCPR